MRLARVPACCVALVLAVGEAETRAQEADAQADKATASEPAYPIGVAVGEEGRLVVVDLDLPGVWVQPAGGEPSILVTGSRRLREPLNRPRAVAIGPAGEVLVGDTATREIYRIDADGKPQPLTEGGIGIPIDLAISSEGTVYASDLETRTIVRLPLAGGQPERFAQANARGLYWDQTGNLWAVTQESQPLVRIDSEGQTTPVVSERVFEFPHDVIVAEDGTAYVSDGYRKTIWRIPSGGEPEPWYEGEPLQNPVGMSWGPDGEVLVADPHAKKVFAIDPESKEVSVRFGA